MRRSRALIIALSLLTALIGSGPMSAMASSTASTTSAVATPSPWPAVSRVDAADSYGIAIASSQRLYPIDGTAGVVVVASGQSYGTATLAAAAAASFGAPLLLTRSSTLPSAVRAELERLAPASIVIVGGTSTIAASVEADLAGIQPATSRVTATDTYALSIALARAAFPAGASHVFVMSGAESANTVTTAVLAAHTGAPLVFVRSTDSSPRPALTDLLSDLGVMQATIVGSTASVKASFASGLSDTGITVDRLTGADPLAMSYAIAARFGTVNTAMLVSQSSYATGVGAVPLAVSIGAPMLLSMEYCVQAGLSTAISSSAATSIELIGSTSLLRNLVASNTACKSRTDPTSYWVLVNKKRPLKPATYVPADLRYPSVVRVNNDKLRGTAATALEQMVAAAKSEGAGRIGLVSGYRSYATQKALYARYVATRGAAWADARSARPGFSEHQTGLAMDLVACSANGCSSLDALAATKQGAWLSANAYRFGFVLRYEPGRSSSTGYTSEPWHFRFVGRPLAQDYHDSGFHTLEGYLDAAPAPSY